MYKKIKTERVCVSEQKNGEKEHLKNKNLKLYY